MSYKELKKKELFSYKCPECKKIFMSKRKDKIFCTDKCRNKAWVKNHPRYNLGKGNQ